MVKKMKKYMGFVVLLVLIIYATIYSFSLPTAYGTTYGPRNFLPTSYFGPNTICSYAETTHQWVYVWRSMSAYTNNPNKDNITSVGDKMVSMTYDLQHIYTMTCDNSHLNYVYDEQDYVTGSLVHNWSDHFGICVKFDIADYASFVPSDQGPDPVTNDSDWALWNNTTSYALGDYTYGGVHIFRVVVVNDYAMPSPNCSNPLGACRTTLKLAIIDAGQTEETWMHEYGHAAVFGNGSAGITGAYHWPQRMPAHYGEINGQFCEDAYSIRGNMMGLAWPYSDVDFMYQYGVIESTCWNNY